MPLELTLQAGTCISQIMELMDSAIGLLVVFWDKQNEERSPSKRALYYGHELHMHKQNGEFMEPETKPGLIPTLAMYLPDKSNISSGE